MKIYFIITLVIFSFVTNLVAQKISYVNYGTNEGLPQSQVTSIVQDKQGYLWVGTLGGLAKFNGKDFETYSSESGLLNNRVRSLSIIDEVIWVGHDRGVSRIKKGKIDKWYLPDFQNANIITNIFSFKGRIIISTRGLGLCEFKNNQIVKLKVNSKSISSSYIISASVYNSKIYISSENGLLETSDLINFKPVEAVNKYFISDFQWFKDELFFTTYDKGCFKYDKSKKSLSQIKLNSNTNNFSEIFIDSYSNKWFVSADGLFQLNNYNKVINYLAENGLSTTVTALFEDEDQNIWLGSGGKGLLTFPSENIRYYNTTTGFPSDLITNINQDSKGVLWFSTFDGGGFSLTKRRELIRQVKSVKCIWTSALEVNNANWFGTEVGLICYSKGREKLIVDKNLPIGKVTSLFKVSSSKMYIGGIDGISVYNSGQITKLQSPNNTGEFLGIIRDLNFIDNVLYCATDKGIAIYQNNQFKFLKGVSNTAYCIEKDANSTIWIGTDDGLYSLKKGILKKSIFASEPASNFIIFLNYFKDNLFIGTNNGVFIHNVRLNKYKHLSKQEGLIDLESNINSSFIDENGDFWHGSASGVVESKLGKINFNVKKPYLVLKRLLVNQQDTIYKKYSKSINELGVPSKLVLPFTKNNITIELDAVVMNNHDLKFQYWIEGLDIKWSNPSKNSTFNFSSLPAGEYVLHLRSVIGKDAFSNEIVFPLIIRLPFYKTWWFILSAFIFVLLTFYIGLKEKIKRERQKNYNESLELKSKLMALEQKSLNASMNRHFIFNSLNSIQYFINSQDRISANRYLTNFAKLIRKNLDSTVEEGSMISLSQELEGLELYLSLEAMRFKNRFEYEINVDDIDTESIKVPSMLLQPFIENSIIHGILPIEEKLGRITINVNLIGKILQIQIDDNGVGIEQSIQLKKQVIGDHKSQGMEITSKRIDLIKRLSNQSFELIGPFQIYDENRLINGSRVLLKIPVENLD